MKTVFAFQLPLSRSQALWSVSCLSDRRILSTPSLGITGLKRRWFLLKLLIVTFNSLSRDHYHLVEEKYLAEYIFQLPLSGSHPHLDTVITSRRDYLSTPSLGITCRARLPSSLKLQLPPFNSLSRDHSPGDSAGIQLERSGTDLSTPSLGIT